MVTCYGCFQSIPENSGVCPICGFNAEQQKKNYPSALKPGSILGGRYIVGKVLGQGGFGITYSAREYKTKRLVAIKEYFPETLAVRAQNATTVSYYAGDRENAYNYGKECFLSEAQTLSKFIGNDNIVDVFSYFEENCTAYFVMEYINGESLMSYIRKRGGRISFEEARLLLLPVMKALETVHRAGIIHRDISPDNIFITTEGTVKLIDFGAARYSLGDRSRSLDVVLKHGYAPVEQYTRRGRQGPYTDVYSMSATFYRAITGRIPPESIDRMADDVLITPSTLGVALPAEAENVLLSGLEVLYRDRLQTMHELRVGIANAPLSGNTHSDIYGDNYYIPVEQQRKAQAEVQRKAREEAESKAREEAQRKAREEAERKAREEAQRKAREEAERKAREEAQRKAREEAESKAREEAERKAREEAERKAREEAERKARKEAKKSEKVAVTTNSVDPRKKKKIIVILASVIAVATIALVIMLTSGKSEPPQEKIVYTTVPELTGMTWEEAEDKCKEYNLVLEKDYQQEYSDTVRAGLIISQSIAFGDEVEGDTDISVVISKGIERIIVPDLAEKTTDEAKSALEKVGLKFKVDKETQSDKIKKGCVISQSIKAGNEVAKGTTVTVIVSKGPIIIVPDLSGKTSADAKAALEKIGLKYKAEKETFSDKVKKGCVISQSIKAGNTAVGGTVVTVVISKGQKPQPTEAVSDSNNNSGSYGDSGGYDNSGSDNNSNYPDTTVDYYGDEEVLISGDDVYDNQAWVDGDDLY